ncbi:MAG: CDP-alcohol phosphatidyltransferase family protein [Gemmatimonadetes bacterium]|nr:CDP-alcohol phosphatidyltransferase family protein [Gemmatimonadota bacterium]
MLKQLPNVLTSLRIAAIPALVWLAATQRHDPFTTILIACLVGDIADGILARALRATSELGAMLDSIADTLLFFTAIYGAWVFYPDALRAHPAAFALVPGLWLTENVAALLRYGRLSSFHTYLSRIAAYALGFFIGLLFLTGFKAWLLYAAVAFLTVATLEEFALLALLPEWTADVRGLWWVLKARDARGPARGPAR